MIKGILLFHLRVGVRLALQSFTPLFSAIVALIMLQMYPAAMVRQIARQIWGDPPSTGMLALLAALAFALPAWAAPRMAHGLNGWMRHLPVGSSVNRRGLALALGVVQLPLLVSVGILAFAAPVPGVAHLALLLSRVALVVAGAAVAAVPAKNRFVSVPLSAAGGLTALFGDARLLLPALMLVLAADAVSGPLMEKRARREWHAAGAFLAFRIAWRALAWRILSCYAVALIPLGFAALFIRNNALTGELLAGTARFCGSMAVVLFLSSASEKLSIRRPVWPWARSLALSSYRRVLTDASFLGCHASVVLVPVAFIHAWSAGAVLLMLPLLASLAAGHMRRIHERRAGNAQFVLEGFLVSAAAAFSPWACLLSLVAAPAAIASARNLDSRQKVTRWLEKHHDAGGDSLSWSA